MIRTKASVVWRSLRVAKPRSTLEASAWCAIMRPNRSFAMPPTKTVGAASRDSPTANLRQEPPTMGRTASPPSAAATGTKSISASPQLRIMVFDLSGAVDIEAAHGLAAAAIQLTQKPVDLPLPAMELG